MRAAIKEARARAKLVVQDYAAFDGTSVEMVTEAREFLDATAGIPLKPWKAR
jgi:hypothetical protein